jgi:hypothetical protein
MAKPGRAKPATPERELLRAEAKAIVPWKTFLEPVQLDVKLTKVETEIVNTRDFQRLGRIRQLGSAVSVFRGATHTRFDHCLGTLAVAERMVQAINHSPRETEKIEYEAHVVVRLVALLHDITHVAFGHTLEDEIGVFPRHDESGFAEFLGPSAEIGQIIVSHHGEETRALVQQTLEARPDAETDDAAIKALRYPYAADIVGNTLCADLIDYLRRDAYFTGLTEAFRERFLDYLFIPSSGPHANRLVVRVNKRENDEVRTDQLTDLVSLLHLRYRLAERVYYHHTKMKLGAMIGRAVLESEFASDRRTLYPFGDDALLEHLRRGGAKRESGQLRVSMPASASARLAEAMLDRTLYRAAWLTRSREDQSGAAVGIRERLQQLRDPRVHTEWVRWIEDELDLLRGDVVFYNPSAKMQKKLARALVAYGEDTRIRELGSVSEGEIKTELDLIQRQHERLWRFMILVHPSLGPRTRYAVAKAFERRWAEQFPEHPIHNEFKELVALDLEDNQKQSWFDRLTSFRERLESERGSAVPEAVHESVVATARSRPSNTQWKNDRPTMGWYRDTVDDIERKPSSS